MLCDFFQKGSDMNRAPLLVALAAVFLPACATTIPAGNKPRTAPKRNDKATVYVIDDLGGINIGPGEIVVVNGKAVSVLSRREYTWFYVAPGTMDISMNDPAIKSRKMSARRWEVDAGKSYYVRYKIASYRSDGALLGDIITGAGNNAVEFSAEDLLMIPEPAAQSIMQGHKLVGSQGP